MLVSNYNPGCTATALTDAQIPISPDSVFDGSLVPETCRDRFIDFKESINEFLEH
jgi:hypothetical protein